MGHETPRARRLRAVGAALLVLAIIGLVTHDVVLGRRVATLEAAVAERDKADPLMPFECRDSLPGRGGPAGASRENPCVVSFQRLLAAPQQFAGRWVEVQGRYVSGMETSALFPLDSTPRADTPWERTEHAPWVGVAPFAPLDAQQHGVFVRRFRRGPAGHLASYFASLENQ